MSFQCGLSEFTVQSQSCAHLPQSPSDAGGHRGILGGNLSGNQHSQQRLLDLPRRQSSKEGRKSRIKAQKKIKRTNSNLENLEQRNAAEHSGTKKSMPEDAQVSLAIMVKLCLRWRFSMDSKEIRDLVQAYVKANKKLEGAAGNHLRKYCRDRGWVSLFFWVLVSV